MLKIMFVLMCILMLALPAAAQDSHARPRRQLVL
jgi:biopolymer transport protein ExbD